MKSIIIFGGSGYVGKNLIRSFAKHGHKIIVPHQKQINEANLRLLGSIGQIVPLYFSSLKNPKILTLLNTVDVCINLKTSWDSKKSTLTKSIFNFNQDLVKIIKSSSSIKKFIFFSGLGVEKKLTFRNEIILKTEDLISKELESSIILRSSVILGNGDLFLSSLKSFFKMSFFIPLFGDGSKKFQPVLVEDIEQFLNNAILQPNIDKKLFELGGPETFTYKEFYSKIVETMNKKRVFLPIPMPLVRAVVWFGEKIPFFPITSEQLSLFDTDNLLNKEASGFDYFKIVPKKIISAIEKSL